MHRSGAISPQSPRNLPAQALYDEMSSELRNDPTGCGAGLSDESVGMMASCIGSTIGYEQHGAAETASPVHGSKQAHIRRLQSLFADAYTAEAREAPSFTFRRFSLPQFFAHSDHPPAPTLSCYHCNLESF